MKFYKYVFCTLFLSTLIFVFIVHGIIYEPKGIYSDSYQSVIQDKFRILITTDDPKIIIVGGSNCAFGINQKMIEDASGYKVVNMGLHAGFGHMFYSELAKANVNKGDIVLLAYEYDWPYGNAFETVDPELVMSAIDNDISMYKYLPSKYLFTIFKGIIPYASKKNNVKYETEGVYSRAAFDPVTFQLRAQRDDVYAFNPEVSNKLDISQIEISSESIAYLSDFKKFVENSGAKIYFIPVPVAREGVASCEEDFIKLMNEEESLIGIKYIGNPVEYLFASEYMFDSKYHCNSRGEKKRTEILIEDMKDLDIID